MASRRKYDWPQVALVAVVGGLGLAAASVLGVTWEKLASIPPSEWVMIASAAAGVIGTVVAAFRRPMAENSAPSTPVRHVRARETEPPEGGP